MGTNYYLHKGDGCKHCGAGETVLHIGESSCGWCFSLHVIPEEGLNELEDWAPLFQKFRIEDEYGTPVSTKDMMEVITNREGVSFDEPESWFGYASEADLHLKNNSERGPNGLLRHKIGLFCKSHGTGTWDCILGEFS